MSLQANLIDTHAHLDFPQFGPDRDTVIQRARSCGIVNIINIGSTMESSLDSVALSSTYDFIYAAVGVHPHEADQATVQIDSTLRELASCPKVVAIGETGLDYYKGFSRPENQKPLFLRMINLAKELNKPLVIHSRQAQDDTIKILREEKVTAAVVHCFSGDEDFLRACLDAGYMVSFTCNITYKKADNLRKLVELAPLERIMLETDAPYLSPEGERGKRNEPIQVAAVAAEIARIKSIDINEVARVTTENSRRFFRIPQ